MWMMACAISKTNCYESRLAVTKSTDLTLLLNQVSILIFSKFSASLTSYPETSYNISLIIIIIKQLTGLTHYWILCGLSININNYLKSWTWTKMKWIQHSFPWSLWEQSWHVVQPSVWIVWQCLSLFCLYQFCLIGQLCFVYVYFPLLANKC